jgi:tripartite ATP-independent transporter DctM subunit
VLVLYGVLTEEPIGRVLIAGFVPGVMTLGLLMVTAYVLVRRAPDLAPSRDERPALSRPAALRLVWPVPVIFFVSMGGLYFGVFTPTEAGAAGAFLALAYAVATRRLGWTALWEAVGQTVRTTAAIFLIILAGKVFGFFLSVTRIPRSLGAFVGDLDVAPWLVIAAIFVVYFALGAFMDELAILVIMTPIMYPIVMLLGYDGIWFGVLTMMMLLTGLLTPPVGLICFVVAGTTGIPIGRIFRAVTPFWSALIAAIALVIAFPQIATFLPALMR